MLDLQELGRQVGEIVREAVQRATEPLHEQIALLKAAQAVQHETIQDIAGRPLLKGEPGDKGLTGDPGKSVTVDEVRPVLEAAAANWAVGFERHAAELLQRAVDRLPKPKDGVDGVDGLDLKNLEIDLAEDERTFVFKLADDERAREWRVRAPIVLDRGVFSKGSTYLKGDSVTWGGSSFIAQKDAAEGKPGESADWRLAVKRGRDGKDAK